MPIQSFSDVLAALRRFTDQGEPDDPRALKRRRILDAAGVRFERQGYRGTSMGEVARDAAIAKGTVYLYFPSKAELLLHVLMAERARLYAAMAPALLAAEDPADRLRRLVALGVVHAPLMPVSNRLKEGDPELRAALQEVDARSLGASLALFAEIFRWLVASAAPALDDAQVAERAHLLMASFQAVPALLRAKGAVPLDRFAEGLAAMWVHGALAPPPLAPPSTAQEPS